MESTLFSCFNTLDIEKGPYKNMTDHNSTYPIHYCLGESSKRIIIHQQDDLCITHEHLFQDATPTRFYQNQTDTFCFIITGELYLQEGKKETALKKHQGIWLEAKSTNIITLLSPSAELCFIRLKKTDDKISDALKKVSSGTVESILGRNHIQTWPLWQGKSGAILLELYPPHYNETLYYQKNATQYVLPLTGVAFITNGQKRSKPCDTLGQIIVKKEPRAVSNPNNESITLLSVTTSHQKGRVLLLKKSNKP